MGEVRGDCLRPVTELSFNRARRFPNLTGTTHEVTSVATTEYNCVAWALGSIDAWIQPADDETGSPPLFMDWVIGVLGARGFVPVNALPESGDALAVFATAEQFTHIARRLENGRWTSKLGDWEDIEHNDLNCLEGGAYGFVVTLLIPESGQEQAPGMRPS